MKKTIFTIFLSFTALLLSGQIKVSGTITDQQGQPLIGVNIIEQGTSNGTITDFDGNYELSVPEGAILVFSYTGMNPLTEAVNGRTRIDIKMSESSELLDEIVVTALGFKEKRDRLASTYSKIDGDKVVQRGESKIIDGIAGKTSGVRISGASGDPGAGANIQIRGQNTISGSTQPLIIVDGVPLNNDYLRGFGSPSDAGVSQQSRLNDLNPDDIESFQIFKGASAAALYGTRAMNGAIVITTKKGKQGKMNISYTATYGYDEIAYKHPLQAAFGQGANGEYSPTSLFSWGDKIADRTGGADGVNTSGQYFASQVTDNIIYPITAKNSRDVFVDENFDKVFRNGSSLDHKLAISGGNERNTFYFSMGRIDQDGIIRSSDFNKTNFTLATTQKFTDKLSASIKANYINSLSNRVQQGSNTAGVYLGLLRNAPDFDITDYIGDYVSSSGAVTLSRQRSYRRYLGNNDNAIYNNPLWTINEQISDSRINRFIGSAELNYQLTDALSLIARGGGDTYSDDRLYFFPTFTAGADRRFGQLSDEVIVSQEFNFDLLANFNKRITEDFGTNIVLGYGVNSRKRKTSFSRADNFISNFRGLYDPAEVSKKENIIAESSQILRNNYRFYGTANLDYKEQLLLTLGGAYEKHSSLKDGFFYPSAELGWLASKSFEMPQWFTFAKLRASYGQVGNVPLPHRVETVYEVGSFSTFSDNITLEDFGGGYQLDERIGNSDLKPEIKTELEFGADLRFYRNRIHLSATYYTNEITDVLLDISLTPSLGYSEIYGNGATIENTGVEIEAGYKFINKENFTAGFNLNFSRNDNLVTKLTGGGVIDLTPGSSVQGVAIEGHPIGSFYTQDAVRDANGNLILDDNGFPEVDLTGNKIVGDPNPDWRGGLGFNLEYKGLGISILFETSQGNDFSERTRFITSYFGTHADVANEITLASDLINFAGDIIPAGSTVRGNIRNFGGGDVLLDESFYTVLYGFGDGKLNSFTISDGSWTRIREASISYRLRNQSLKKMGIQDMNFSLTGRNLVIWTDLAGVDPDINQFGVGLGQGIDYFTNPGTRAYAASIQVTF